MIGWILIAIGAGLIYHDYREHKQGGTNDQRIRKTGLNRTGGRAAGKSGADSDPVPRVGQLKNGIPTERGKTHGRIIDKSKSNKTGNRSRDNSSGQQDTPPGSGQAKSVGGNDAEHEVNSKDGNGNNSSNVGNESTSGDERASPKADKGD